MHKDNYNNTDFIRVNIWFVDITHESKEVRTDKKCKSKKSTRCSYSTMIVTGNGKLIREQKQMDKKRDTVPHERWKRLGLKIYNNCRYI